MRQRRRFVKTNYCGDTANEDEFGRIQCYLRKLHLELKYSCLLYSYSNIFTTTEIKFYNI